MKRKYICGKLIKQIHDEMEKQANNSLVSKNLTLTQMRLLMELEAAPQHQLTLKKLETLLHASQPTVAGIVTRLEQKGYIETLPDKSDKRIKHVLITNEGLNCCKNAEEQIKHMEERLLSGLDESERIIFSNLLNKVFQSL